MKYWEIIADNLSQAGFSWAAPSFFCNFMPKKPDNKLEGVHPNWLHQLPIGMPSLRAKRCLSSRLALFCLTLQAISIFLATDR
jgi:hypothetical protein